VTTNPTVSAPAAVLRGLCGGAVHLPGDPGYDAARTPWNVAVDQRPAAVAYPGSAPEVADVVRAATAAGLRVAVQGTGHNAGPLPDLGGSILLRTSAMTAVTIDATARTARVEAGALWLDVVEAAAPYGLVPLHGSSPDVGVVGYSLGGGLGWYARQLGLQANSVTAIELVTADGELVRTDADHDPDLFWALRGGGGSFGVVTALECTLYPIETAYAGMLVWDWQHAGEVLTRWTEWAATAPDSVTTSWRILQLPPIPEIPEPVRGRNLVVIDGAVLGPDDQAEAIIAPLRALAPEMDTFARVPAASLVRLHMDPEGPTPAVSATALLGELDAEGVTALVAAAGPGSGSPLLVAELRQLGGAVGRALPGTGVLSHVDGAYALFAVAIAPTPEMAAAGSAAGERLVEAMAPWATGGQYLNFAETRVDPRTGYPADSWDRLTAIRSERDPKGLFLANHEVPTGG
jgi:FAD/FMN-containing dehydrogenase